MLLSQNTTQHYGKKIKHFEDEFGTVLDDLYMLTSFVIVFTDDSRIVLGQDWRGDSCYISQYTDNKK